LQATTWPSGGIDACWEDCGQLLSDAGSFLGGDTTTTAGSDVTAISRTSPTNYVTSDITISTDTTRIITSDNPAALTSETSQLTRGSDWVPNPGGRLGGSLHREVINDIAEFIKSKGLTPDREYYLQSVHRFADVVALDGPGGNPVEIYQVGRMTSQFLLPVAREIYAAGDILDALGIPVIFVPYNV
jgi:hypothetical protein